MRRPLALVARLVAPMLVVLVAPMSARADPKAEAMQILDEWTKAFAASDVDAIVRLYAPDATFIGTGSKAVVVKPEGIRSYFDGALLTNKPRGASLDSFEVMPLSDTAVVIAGTDTVSGVRDAKPFSVHGRVTFVVQKLGPEWKIVHFHRSAMPN